MRKVYGVLGWGIIALGALHMASTPRALTASAVWFFSGGIAMVLTGAMQLTRRAAADAERHADRGFGDQGSQS